MGLDVFREYFAGHADQFVLIGGTAATLATEEAGLEFRATKDLDIVLHIEALSPAFGEVFWSFVEAGGYEFRRASETGRPIFNRFQKPSDKRFPIMLELFFRAPNGIKLAELRRFQSTRPWRAFPRSCSTMRTTTSCSQVAEKSMSCRGWARTGHQEYPQARERRATPVAIASAGRSHTRGREKRVGSESLRGSHRGRSFDRSEIRQDLQQRRRACRTYRADVPVESTPRSRAVTLLSRTIRLGFRPPRRHGSARRDRAPATRARMRRANLERALPAGDLRDERRRFHPYDRKRVVAATPRQFPLGRRVGSFIRFASSTLRQSIPRARGAPRRSSPRSPDPSARLRGRCPPAGRRARRRRRVPT